MTDFKGRPLLGRLAGTPWLSRHGEVLAVQAVALVIEDARARQGWSGLLESTVGLPVSPELTWTAEASEREAGRPDLVAASEGEPVRFVVEAKFEHRISRKDKLGTT